MTAHGCRRTPTFYSWDRVNGAVRRAAPGVKEDMLAAATSELIAEEWRALIAEGSAVHGVVQTIYESCKEKKMFASAAKDEAMRSLNNV